MKLQRSTNEVHSRSPSDYWWKSSAEEGKPISFKVQNKLMPWKNYLLMFWLKQRNKLWSTITGNVPDFWYFKKQLAGRFVKGFRAAGVTGPLQASTCGRLLARQHHIRHSKVKTQPRMARFLFWKCWKSAWRAIINLKKAIRVENKEQIHK